MGGILHTINGYCFPKGTFISTLAMQFLFHVCKCERLIPFGIIGLSDKFFKTNLLVFPTGHGQAPSLILLFKCAMHASCASREHLS